MHTAQCVHLIGLTENFAKLKNDLPHMSVFSTLYKHTHVLTNYLLASAQA